MTMEATIAKFNSLSGGQHNPDDGLESDASEESGESPREDLDLGLEGDGSEPN